MRVRLPEATICLVASMPSRFGIRMSSRITSGSSSATRAIGSRAVFGLADDLQVRPALDDQPEPAANERLVVGDRDPDAQLASSIGIAARDAVTSPRGCAGGKGAAEKREPAHASRSGRFRPDRRSAAPRPSSRISSSRLSP